MDYVFNDILEPHQQIRIKVSLGLEDDPSGAGYNVNQSKIAIGFRRIIRKRILEWDADQIEVCAGTGYGFLLLYGRRGARLFWSICRIDRIRTFYSSSDCIGGAAR